MNLGLQDLESCAEFAEAPKAPKVQTHKLALPLTYRTVERADW